MAQIENYFDSSAWQRNSDGTTLASNTILRNKALLLSIIINSSCVQYTIHGVHQIKHTVHTLQVKC